MDSNFYMLYCFIVKMLSFKGVYAFYSLLKEWEGKWWWENWVKCVPLGSSTRVVSQDEVLDCFDWITFEAICPEATLASLAALWSITLLDASCCLCQVLHTFVKLHPCCFCTHVLYNNPATDLDVFDCHVQCWGGKSIFWCKCHLKIN